MQSDISLINIVEILFIYVVRSLTFKGFLLIHKSINLDYKQLSFFCKNFAFEKRTKY